MLYIRTCTCMCSLASYICTYIVLVHVYLGVLCCFALFVCLFDPACFFLSSFSSLIKTCKYVDFLLSLVCLPHLSPSTHLNSLSLHRCGSSLVCLPHLSPSTHLNSLSLHRCGGSLVCLPHLSPSTHLNSLSLHRCGGSLTAKDSPGFLDESGSVLLQLLLLEADDHTEQLVLEPLQGHGVVDDGRAPEYGRSVLGVGELGVQVQSATQCQVSGVRCQVSVSGVRCQCQVSGVSVRCQCQVSGVSVR